MPGEDFVVLQRYLMPGLPEEVQVGFVTYTNWEKAGSYFGSFGYAFQNSTVLNETLAADPTPAIPFNPDLLARFDYARFNEVDLPPGLAFVNLMNTAAVSDADLLGFLSYPSEAADPEEEITPYLAIYQAGHDHQQVWNGMTWDQLNARWTALGAANLRLVDVDAYQEDGQWRYSGVWRDGTYPHLLLRFASWRAFVQRWRQLNAEDMRLVDVETYHDGARQQYVGVWRQGTDKYALYNYNSWNGFTRRWKKLAIPGQRLIDVETYVHNGRRRFLGVWRGGEGPYALYLYNSRGAFLHKEAEISAAKNRLIDLETIRYKKRQWYLGVWNDE